MIESIGIKNYKSIVDLQFDVGRVNIFIGENGSGKSNILEAIALASAAEADKLDNEFLANRGIRVTSPLSMMSTFEPVPAQVIEITIKFDAKEKTYQLENDGRPYSKWTCRIEPEAIEQSAQNDELAKNKNNESADSAVDTLQKSISDLLELNSGEKPSLSDLSKLLSQEIRDESYAHVGTLFDLIWSKLREEKNRIPIANIIIYSPEETALRNLYREGQIEPLGIHGEGLLKLIKVLDKYDSDIPLETIKESLSALGWFEDIDISSSNSIDEEERISIFDRFTQSWFDQRSANEGFLFVLFYAALMVSQDTPSIFAIDNVDASLNPKLCTKIVGDIVKLAKKFDKQCFLTAHNPAVLDAIDLEDDDQRLFVVSRNRKGHTLVKRIGLESKPVSSTGEELKLSEAFLRGYLGGLPKNF
ncbi:MAG: AAA family ATPase [Cyanobacteria bacterium P01_F01_bin.150]